MTADFINLIEWSSQFESLPWRQSRSLYHTLVSEVMLQQTTVSTVLSKFPGFVETFRSITELANASEEQVLIAWKGLGYYRRARNLLKAAIYICEHYNSIIPRDYHKLLAIPGIGDYTACALLAIGYNDRKIAVDTNIERVLSRYYNLDAVKGTALKRKINGLVDNRQIFDSNLSFRDLNEALMDLGREYCKTSNALCQQCALQASCKSAGGNPLALPVVLKKTKVSHRLSLLRVLVIDNGHLWCYKKNHDEWLSNQYECPTYILESDDESLNQYSKLAYTYKNLISYKTAITKYSIVNYITIISLAEFKQKFSWTRQLVKLQISEDANFSTATQKALSAIMINNPST